ncbi:hypothetical protein SO802_033690 [Lithocarpus litseifolius]|uniref:Uncharacterized protein n=1 Tax=Lithocarpus litseifolius TaxID=425828 RepID=A0AAW2BJ57_9ROSI
MSVSLRLPRNFSFYIYLNSILIFSHFIVNSRESTCYFKNSTPIALLPRHRSFAETVIFPKAVFLEPDEGYSWSSERETSARSPDEDVESYVREGEKEDEIFEGKVEGNEIEENKGEKNEGEEREGGEACTDEGTLEVGSSRSPGDGFSRPFILPRMWTVNDFLPKMTTNIFKDLRDRYQIPDHIPICLPGKCEKCYSGKTADVDRSKCLEDFYRSRDFVGLSKWCKPSAYAIRVLLVLQTSTHSLVLGVRPHISEEQEDFIRQVTEIPLEERKCRDLITLDTLHLYYRGLEPMLIARKLNAYSRRQMEASRQRVRVAAACKKEKEKKTKLGEFSSAPKAVGKGAIKRKGDGKDNYPPKKASITPLEKVLKKPSPPKHGVGKGLMSLLGPITQDSERRLLTHKEYAVEMLDSIIKDKNADPCVGQALGDLGDSSLFDLARIIDDCSIMQAMVRMKALQVKGVANEGVIARQQKHIKKVTDEQDRYKETLRFEDCLKLVKSYYLDLDLAKVSMDDPLPSTPAGDAVPEYTDGSIESGQNTRDDSIVLAQLAARSPVLPLTPLANPSIADDSPVHDAPDFLPKGDEAP